MATSAEGSWSARIAAQEGIAFYEGLGARFDTEGNPVRLDSEELAPQLALAQDDSGQKDAA